jgi:1-acyl-sn-glycerol-3-phosphate acyltransferase
MWLQGVLSTVADVATRTYYRLGVSGSAIPAQGPVLLVANHPNSLLDPAVLTVIAGRRLRFLAKAPLFGDPQVGWLVRGFGAIPVYRAQDDPGQTRRNEETFRAVYDALFAEDAIGIFPEGISHSEPSLAPLKTGAARIVLGAYDEHGTEARIIPVGLSFREKDVFRSDALALIGEPVPWLDLLESEPDPVGRVRALTGRIDAALHDLTLNLSSWEDLPVVECAEAVLRAERGVADGPRGQLVLQGEMARLIPEIRTSSDVGDRSLDRRLRRHSRLLTALRLSPGDVLARPGAGATARWTLRNLPLFGLLPSLLAALGCAFFWLPYRIPGWSVARAEPLHDVRATHKLLVGTLSFLVWFALWAAVIGLLFGWPAALGSLLLLPAWAWATLYLYGRWRRAGSDAFRFFRLRRHEARRQELARAQQELAHDLESRLSRARTVA